MILVPRYGSTAPSAAQLDGFFTALENTQPYFKCAFEGFAGAGKTFTAVEIALGLHKRIGSRKPIAYFDTEKAGRHLRARFAQAGIQVLYKPSRSLADLREVMLRGREGAFDILLVDSITHVWEHFLNTYLASTRQQRLYIQDWGVLKPRWKGEFSDPFVTDRYHAIMCGRAAYEYDEEQVQDARTGEMKRDIWKSGIKMKAEGETAYEPDMLVLMERQEELLGDKKAVYRLATVVKDRSTLLDGQTFRDPKFSHFAPAVEYILDEPVERAAPAERENEFGGDGDERRSMGRRRDIALETIEVEMTKAGLVGQAREAMRGKVAALERAFGTASWTAISGLPMDRLEAGVEALKEQLGTRAAAPKD
jgi:hypothetical protein